MTIISYRRFVCTFGFVIVISGLFSQSRPWGDLGNGQYENPILAADYSDPDVIRVEDKYYMVCSDFHYIGMPVLESDDMVNWRIISQVYDQFDFPEWSRNDRYGGGSWAPVIRYHEGMFRVFFCTPHEGLFMSKAKNPEGPWSPLLNVVHVEGWEDPCPFWDDDGEAYLGRSQLGGGPIIIHKMNNDGTELLDEGVIVYEGPTAEGTKIHKINGSYYLSIPEGGVATGWQTVLRSGNMYGPYESRKVLEQGSTKINGPHQGALVDTPDGEWWFFHFQDTHPLGRIVHLEPVRWEEGWPVIGIDYDHNGVGEPVKQWTKPIRRQDGQFIVPQGSDDFNLSKLSLQWQFNHNPSNEHWSLNEREGYFRIKSLRSENLRQSRNMLTQKVMGYHGEASTEVDCSRFSNGQRAGLLCTGNTYNAIGAARIDDKDYIYTESNGVAELITELKSNIVYFKVSLDSENNQYLLYYSFDNKAFIPCVEPFSIYSSDWKGARIGLFSYNTGGNVGIADFNWFRYSFDGATEKHIVRN